MTAVPLLGIIPWLVISSSLPSTFGMLVMYAEDQSVYVTAAKQTIQGELNKLIEDFQPGVTYVAGCSFSSSFSYDQTDFEISVNLYFYSLDVCGPNVSSVLRSATGQTLQTEFKSVMQELVELMGKSYGTGYAVSGQFQAGYTINKRNAVPESDVCTTLTMDTSKNASTGYCYGYKNILLANTAFNKLQAGCQLESPNKQYALKMQQNCLLELVDTAVNRVLWSANNQITPQRGCFLIVQSDWNLVIYNATHHAQWASRTYVPLDGQLTGTASLNVGSNRGLSLHLTIPGVQGIGGVQEIWSSHTEIIGADGSSGLNLAPENLPKNERCHASATNLKTILSISLPFAMLSLGLLSIVLWQRKQLSVHKDRMDEEAGGSGLFSADAKVEKYTFKALEVATDGFHEENKLGQGGSGAVYKGILPALGVVAIKHLDNLILSDNEHVSFLNEVSTISSLQHKNLIKLRGFCCEGEHRLLVYEYMKNNSLSQALLGNKVHLPWATRYDICLGVARGIAYIHEESRMRIVHRDIKASNILLDEDLNARVADFGLARLLKDNASHDSTRAAGTFGYLAPEYALHGRLSEKVDVYSFGILALEMLSGRHNMDFTLPPGQSLLLEWAWQLYEEGNWLHLIDARLAEECCSREQLNKVFMVSLSCTQAVPTARPAMSRVLGMLVGDVALNTNISRPGFLPD